MTRNNTRNTSSETYFHSLDFSYVVTYSLQRGKRMAAWKKQVKQGIRILRERLDHTVADPSVLQKELAQLERYRNEIQFLMDTSGQFHPTAVPTHVIRKDDPHMEEIKTLLQTPAVNIPAWMCAPVYRDALVFYDADEQIVSILHICLSCEYMQTEDHTFIQADQSVYESFREFFTALGHKTGKQ